MQNTMSRRTMEQMAAQRDRSGSLWLVQAFSGLALVAILGLHMIAHHFIVEGGLRDYQQVLDYVANPIVFVIEVLFVILATVLPRRAVHRQRSEAERQRQARGEWGAVGRRHRGDRLRSLAGRGPAAGGRLSP